MHTAPSEVQGGTGGSRVEADSVGIRSAIGGERDTGVVEGGDTCVLPISCRFAYFTGRCTTQGTIAMPSTEVKAMCFHLVPLGVQPNHPHFGTSSHSGEEVPSTFVFWNQHV
jgi:hypothetical protein